MVGWMDGHGNGVVKVSVWLKYCQGTVQFSSFERIKKDFPTFVLLLMFYAIT